MRILYFGMSGTFSQIPLAHLLANGVDVCGVVVPTGDEVGIRPLPPPQINTDIPLLNPYFDRNIIQLGWQHGIPVWEVGDLSRPEVVAALSETKPDLAIVACFSKRIPQSLLETPTHDFLNLHPSLLPKYRGAQPLFWSFREGDSDNGVTLHFMDAGFDSGDIALQQRVTFPDGVSGNEADRICAELGGRMMVEAIGKLEGGKLERVRQTAVPSYAPNPTAADFVIETSWTARRAFNFMRGTAEWERLYAIILDDGRKVVVKTAVAFHPTEKLSQPVSYQQNRTFIQFQTGWLQTQ